MICLHQCVDHGAYVTAHYNTEPGPLVDLQTGVDDLNLVQADVTDEHAITDLFESATEFFVQEVQVLVGGFVCQSNTWCLTRALSSANQGMFPPEDVRLVDMGLDRWKRTMDANLTGKLPFCPPNFSLAYAPIF